MRRTSSLLLAAGLAIALTALAFTMYAVQKRRDFSGPTAITIGSVVRLSAAPGRRRAPGPGLFCWVSYEFTPPGGGSRKGWSMWTEACGLKRDGPIPIQYVVANPDMHRPPGGGPPISPLLLWFAAGVLLVIGVIRRGSETDS